MNPKAHIEINLDNVIHNLDQIRSRLNANQSVIAVVKDCAYGCGAQAISHALEAAGVDFFAVARVAEAASLREAGIHSRILVFGEAADEDLDWVAENNVRLSINDVSCVSSLDRKGTPFTVHINIDTGMGRLGVFPSEVNELAARISECTSIEVEALYSHFASADVPGTDTIHEQIARFEQARTTLCEAGIRWSFVHLPNSAAITRAPLDNVDMVRPGISLYGCATDPDQKWELELKPVASLKAPVVKLKRVSSDCTISYGGLYTALANTHIATIPVGYANGVPRALTGKGDVLIGGKRYPIAGRVTMDYIMVDAGESPEFSIGDEAAVLGPQGDECITADEIARHCNTIGYEILCNLNPRTERRYFRNGECVHVQPSFNY